MTAHPVEIDAGGRAAACPVCGAYAGESLAHSSALLAVCDVLVVRALETVGKRLVRQPGAGRSRYAVARRKGWHTAHTMWTPNPQTIDKGLEGSWDVIPALLDNHGCCGVTSVEVKRMIDGYVRDLLITGTPHSIDELRYRMGRFLGVALPAQPGYTPAPPQDSPEADDE